MSMFFETSYIIKAKPLLKQRVSKYPKDSGAFLLIQTQILRNKEGGGMMWKPQHYAIKVKLLFLAFLKLEYSSLNCYQEILGVFPISTATFNRWYTLERVEDDECTENIEKSLTSFNVAKTGILPIDEWINSLNANLVSNENK